MRKLLFKLSFLFINIALIIVTNGKLYGSNEINEFYEEISTSVFSTIQETLYISSTWDGSTNNSWNEKTNWSNDLVPTYETNVTIPAGGNQPTIYGLAECNNITISLNATLTIDGFNTLTVYGNWINAGSFVANTSTVIYKGNAQSISGISNYNNVIISGDGLKTNNISNFIVNGILSIEGSSGVSIRYLPIYGINATLRYNSDNVRISGVEWPATFTSKGGIIIDGPGIITTSQSKILDESVPLLINSGATLSINDKGITFKGNFYNNGTFRATNAPITIDGIQSQNIDGFTTSGNLIIDKSVGTVTLTSNVIANELQTKNSGVLNLGEGLSHTFTGTWIKGNSTLHCGSSTLRLGSGYSGTSGVFTASSGTVEWFSNSDQNICVLPYNHLVISGTGIKTLLNNINISGNLTVHTGAKLDLKVNSSRNTGISLIVNGTLMIGTSFPSGFTYFNNEGGSIEYNGAAQDIKTLNYYNLIFSGTSTKTITGNTTIMNNLTIRDGVNCKLGEFSSTANTLTLGNYGQVSGTWGSGISGATHLNSLYFATNLGILTVNESIITPGLWIGLNNEWANTINWSDGIVPTSSTDAILSSTGIDPFIINSAACNNLTILPATTLEISNNSNLVVSKDWVNNGTFNPKLGTVNFNGSDQLIGKGPFYNLTLSGSGIKTISSEVLVTNILSMEGTASVSSYVPFTSTGILQYNTPNGRTTGPEWPATISIASIIICNSGEISFSGSKNINTVPILIKEDATLNIKNYNLTTSGALNLECGALNKGSMVIGTGSVILKGNINVSDMGHGKACANILCKLNMTGIFSIIIANGNKDKSSDTDLFINTIEGNSPDINKTGEGTLFINNWGKFDYLKINAGNVIIPVNAEVSVINETAINSPNGILIQSDVNGSGSLITKTVSGTGNAIVECFMTSNAWHLVAPPIVSQNIGNFLLTNVTIPTNQYDERGTRDYDPVLNEWKDFFTNETPGNLTFGKGYSMRVRESQVHEIVFSGMLNAGDITIGNLSAANWNCIGNPYTSAIGINISGTGINTANFLTVNASNIDPAYGIYIWDRTDAYNGQSNQYTAISNVPTPGTSYPVQIGQAFMVKMAPTKTAVSFTKAMQLHQPGLRLKSAEAVWPLIELIVEADSVSSSTVIAFHEGMTRGLDPGYDAGLLSAGAALEISTLLVEDYGIPFAIQALPDKDYESIMVPIDIDYPLGGKISFSAKGIQLPAGCSAILEDRLNNTCTNLISQNYKTTVVANSPRAGRFFLHTSYNTTGVGKANSLESIKAWVKGNGLIGIRGKVSGEAKARLYDMQGLLILAGTLKEGNYNDMQIPLLPPGMYVLHIEDNNSLQTFKMAFIH